MFQKSKESGKTSKRAATTVEVDSSKPEGKSKRKNLQSYLLALLTHHTSWTSLHNCISLLLQKNSLTRQSIIFIILTVNTLKEIMCNKDNDVV